MTHREYVKTSEVAEKFGVTVLTVRRWIEKGVVKGVKVGGRWFVEADSLKQINRKPSKKK